MSDANTRLAAMNARLVGLYKAEPKTMQAYTGLARAASREGALPTATKEAIAVAIAAARGCEDCILYHVAEAKKHGLDRAVLAEVLAVAVEMSGGPGAVYAAKAIEAYDGL